MTSAVSSSEQCLASLSPSSTSLSNDVSCPSITFSGSSSWDSTSFESCTPPYPTMGLAFSINEPTLHAEIGTPKLAYTPRFCDDPFASEDAGYEAEDERDTRNSLDQPCRGVLGNVRTGRQASASPTHRLALPTWPLRADLIASRDVIASSTVPKPLVGLGLDLPATHPLNMPRGSIIREVTPFSPSPRAAIVPPSHPSTPLLPSSVIPDPFILRMQRDGISVDELLTTSDPSHLNLRRSSYPVGFPRAYADDGLVSY